MVKGSAALHIARPPEAVFDHYADMRHENDWNPDASGVVKLSDGPVGAGTTFQGQYKGMGSVTLEIVEHERPRRLHNRGTANSFAFESWYELTPDDGGTRVDARMEVAPRGWYKLLGPLMGPMMQKKFTETLTNFKRALETPEPAAQP